MSRNYIRITLNGVKVRATSGRYTESTADVNELYNEFIKLSDDQLRKECSYTNPESVHGTVVIQLVSKKDKLILESCTRRV